MGDERIDWRGFGVTPVVVAITLRTAALGLQERGWYQGRFRDPDSEATDATQAIAAVLGMDLMESATRELRLPIGGISLLGATLACVAEHSGWDVLAKWNDAVATSVDEVVALFHAAADACDALDDSATA